MSNESTVVFRPSATFPVRRRELIDSLPEESFDRLVRLAARLLDAPIALVTVLEHDRQLLKSAVGLEEPLATQREMPIAYSFCQYATDSEMPLVIEDARTDPRTRDSPSIAEYQSVAYLGVPLKERGQILGTICVIDRKPRRWSAIDIQTLQDLAASAQSEIELRAAAIYSARQAEILDATHDSIIVRDMDDRITLWNRGAEQCYGWTREEALGQVSDQLLQTRFPGSPDEIREELLVSGYWEGDLVHSTKSGANVVVSSRWSLQRDLSRDPLAILEINHDVTDRREIERALKQSDANFRSMIENASEVITVTDGEGVIRYKSPAASRVLGYPVDELLGRPFMEFMHPDDQDSVSQLFEQLLAKPREPVPYEVRFRHADGRYRRLEGIATNLLDDPAVGGIVSNSRDATERLRIKRQLAAYAVELERSNRELQDFAYIASHDLQEPLRKVQSFGDRLKSRYADAFDEMGRDYLERMQNAAGRMQVLIEDLLAYSRVTAKAQPFELLSLTEVAEAVLADLSTRVDATGANVSLHELPEIEADPVQMRQLFQNLFGNSLKFHRENVPPVISASGTVRGNEAEIRIVDNGIGLEMEYAERMFRPFERLHGRLKYEGTGMGLAIVRKIVERHGGNIRVESEPDRGATFIIQLPIRQTPREVT